MKFLHQNETLILSLHVIVYIDHNDNRTIPHQILPDISYHYHHMVSKAELRKEEVRMAWPRFRVSERLEYLGEYIDKYYKDRNELWTLDMDLFRRGMAIEAVRHLSLNTVPF